MLGAIASQLPTTVVTYIRLRTNGRDWDGTLTFAVVAVFVTYERRCFPRPGGHHTTDTPQTGSILQVVVELVFCVCCNLIG